MLDNEITTLVAPQDAEPDAQRVAMAVPMYCYTPLGQ